VSSVSELKTGKRYRFVPANPSNFKKVVHDRDGYIHCKLLNVHNGTAQVEVRRAGFLRPMYVSASRLEAAS
jgi:hypothetical protein